MWFFLQKNFPILNPPHIECVYFSAEPYRPMLSLHHKLEDLYPEKSSDKEEVAPSLIGIKILKDLQGCWSQV